MILTQSPRAGPQGAGILPMATIAREALENSGTGSQCWAEIAGRTLVWARAAQVELRDAIVLVPFTGLLPHARAAFAGLAGWMPRIETTRTLAVAIGPPVPTEPGQVTLDVDVDTLLAAALLRSQPWGAAWSRRDPRAFAQAAAMVVQTAHALVVASAAWPAAERAQRWASGRGLLASGDGPGSTERLLARVAFEWACLSPAPATDRLFALRPSAWIAVCAGGIDVMTQVLLDAGHAPALWVATDAPEDAPFARVNFKAPPALAVCDSFEHEAQCAAAQVLDHLRSGMRPVALIAQDRQLVRRVRAILERQQVGLLDETGWKLSTTRAAAHLMVLLRAARPDAGTDDLIDWLKGDGAGLSGHEPGAVQALEAACRRGHWSRVAALVTVSFDGAAARLWRDVSAWLAALSARDRQPLNAWIAVLGHVLDRCGGLAALQADAAGAQVVSALRLRCADGLPVGWPEPAVPVAMGLAEFTAWVGDTLERASFVPPQSQPDRPAQVVIIPLAQAMLRPFAAVVFPGADNRHLGAPGPAQGLLSEAQAQAFGVPTAAQRRGAELLAFAKVVHSPHLTLLRRRVDGAEPLASSPLVERLAIALAARGAAIAPWHDPRVDRLLAATPIAMTAPRAASLLPARLSATACEAMRACPYRFFALHMLCLREDDELDDEVEKSDYGTWLHAVLFAFHSTRAAPAAARDEVERLQLLAAMKQAEHGLADADFLPFAASFARLAPRYVAWLHRRDAQGAEFVRGEDAVMLDLPEVDGAMLKGVIDRIDSVRHDGGRALQLIDYKTGSVGSLRDKVRVPLEDTQLAFYAALVRAQTQAPLTAMYLALDGTGGLEQVEHKGVEHSAQALLNGLANDMRRLHSGAGLPALGAGSTCEYCAARGVCRRDHWSTGLSA